MNILLVLAGEPPDKQLLQSQIDKTDLVVAVDGGFNTLKKYSLSPDLIIGDLDSVELPENNTIRVVHTPDQNFTDLEKTLEYLLESYTPNSLILLGATGGRTDHLLSNLHVCALVDNSVNITILSEKIISDKIVLEKIIRLTPNTNIDHEVKQGNTLSVLPVTQYSGLATRGLKWDIEHLDSHHNSSSQSNLAIIDDPQFSLMSGSVYIAVYQ